MRKIPAIFIALLLTIVIITKQADALQITIVSSSDLSSFFDLSTPILTGYQEWDDPAISITSAAFRGKEGTPSEDMYLYLYQQWCPYEQGALMSYDPPFYETIVNTLDVNGDSIAGEAYIVNDSAWTDIFEDGEARPESFELGYHTFTYVEGSVLTLSLLARRIEFDMQGYSKIWGAAAENPPMLYERDGQYYIGNIVSPSPPPLTVNIDIKPDSDDNCINNNGHGVIPVAILGSADFDTTQIDPSTCSLAGQAVKAVGKANKLLAHIDDVNGDGFDDLLLQIEDVDGSFEEGDGEATLNCNLYEEYGSTPIEGTDSICIVPPSP